MQKMFSLNIEDFMSENIESEYDTGEFGDRMSIDFEDKKKFLDDIAKQFRKRASELLELEYFCENCGEPHQDKQSIFVCATRNREVCDVCNNSHL